MILVTGASGLLGASLVAFAREQGLEVVGLYHRHAVSISGADIQAVDLTDASATRKIFEALKPATVIHCAAETNVDWCQEHPDQAYRMNVTASAAVAANCASTGARMVYVSTDSVFDGNRGNYAETDHAAPVNIYAQTKLQGEELVLERYPAATVARLTLYGWNAQNKLSLAEWILQELSQDRVVPGFTDIFFCPILANHAARTLLALAGRDLPGLYHLVGSERVSKYEFAQRVAGTFGFDPGKIAPTRAADAKMKAPRPRDVSLNTAKISAALGCAMPDVDAGLLEFARLRDSGYVERIRGQRAGARK
jgi:dTDP-4-dehydrorhamnose reductase